MSTIINPYRFASGGGGSSLFDLIMEDIAALGSPTSAMYFRLNESSGAVANNESGGADGSYLATPSLGNAAIYTGGPQCMQINSSDDAAVWDGTNVPALTELTMGVVWKPLVATGVRQIISRDRDSGGNRYWQWRINSANLEFFNLTLLPSLPTLSVAHGMSDATAYLTICTISSGGTGKLFINSTKLVTGALTASNYGGSNATRVLVGNRDSAAPTEGQSGDYFSEAFILPTEISEARVAQYAAAAGL